MATLLIGARIKARREELKLSQDDLARLFGFKDRQTVSAIETGERRVSAEELLLAVEKLGAPLEYFTDPFRLVGEGRFSWRHTNVKAVHLSGYERNAGLLDRRLPGDRAARRQDRLAAASDSGPHQAIELRRRDGGGGAVRRASFDLGDVPAAAAGRGDGARPRHSGADGRRHRRHLRRRLPPAGARRSADQPPRGDRAASIRSGA